ncbi:MAG TPA: HIT domain-containing protein [Candidatus Saccharimonadia bacterium]|nr:HIT domain-containing protein [Candidatus Saccharimonadia bacterium]
MALIYETPNFIIKSAEPPHVYVSREEGGHIQIKPKVAVSDRTKLSPELAIEYMKLSMVVGEAMKTALGRQGIDIGLINYQDMGNWSVFKPEGPKLHMHVFGRAKDAVKQKYGDAVSLPHLETGFYEDFQPLNDGDVRELRVEIERLMGTHKYQSF